MIYPVLCHYLLGLFCTLVYTHLRILSGVLRVRRGMPPPITRGETITVTMSVTSATATAIPSVRGVRGWGQPIHQPDEVFDF